MMESNVEICAQTSEYGKELRFGREKDSRVPKGGTITTELDKMNRGVQSEDFDIRETGIEDGIEDAVDKQATLLKEIGLD